MKQRSFKLEGFPAVALVYLPLLLGYIAFGYLVVRGLMAAL